MSEKEVYYESNHTPSITFSIELLVYLGKSDKEVDDESNQTPCDPTFYLYWASRVPTCREVRAWAEESNTTTLAFYISNEQLVYLGKSEKEVD